MRTGNDTVDRGIRKLLREGFHTVAYNRANPDRKSVVLSHEKTGEGAVITFGGRQAPVLERGALEADGPDVKMPVAKYLEHWRP